MESISGLLKFKNTVSVVQTEKNKMVSAADRRKQSVFRIRIGTFYLKFTSICAGSLAVIENNVPSRINVLIFPNFQDH